MKNVLCWSGGKDSTASLILCYEKHIKIDEVIFSEVMYDKDISGENPLFIKWVYEVAIPKIKSMGFNITVLRNKETAFDIFNKRRIRGKYIGKKYGLPLSLRCDINSRIKVKNIKNYLKNQKDYVEVIGIACDEQKRLARLKPNQISVLVLQHIKEKETYDICKKYDLLNPLYKYSSRGGCWFCPNQSINILKNIANDKDNVKIGYLGFRKIEDIERKIKD